MIVCLICLVAVDEDDLHNVQQFDGMNAVCVRACRPGSRVYISSRPGAQVVNEESHLNRVGCHSTIISHRPQNAEMIMIEDAQRTRYKTLLYDRTHAMSFKQIYKKEKTQNVRPHPLRPSSAGQQPIDALVDKLGLARQIRIRVLAHDQLPDLPLGHRRQILTSQVSLERLQDVVVRRIFRIV